MIITLRKISLKYGLFPLLDNVDLVINSSEKIALVGRNGAGKSTLLKVIKGLVTVDSGDIQYGQGIKVGMLEQDFSSIKTESIFEIVASGLGQKAELISKYHKISHELATNQNPSEQQLSLMLQLQQQIEDNNAWDSQNQVETIISKLDIDPDANFNQLSGGQKRRVLLAKALVEHPDLLLLDEPTNHLDIESIKWLEELLLNWKTSVLLISHDRQFVRNIATRIIELDRGHLYDWPGSYEHFLKKKEEFLHAEELANQRFDKKLADEEVWIRQGIKARRTRNEGRVRALKKMRQERAQRQSLQGNVKVINQEAIASGRKVIEAKNIQHSFDDKVVIKDFSTLIMRGDKIAIIGPNGCGKTTLINILLKNLDPVHGSVKHGTKLEIAYFDQMRAEIDDSLSVRDNVAGGSDVITINGKNKHVIGYLQDFLFTPERANSPVTVLSGGERNRLLLAKLFTKPSNLFVLDEPTNDLDVETLELLEYLLVNYQGTVLLISHDREFINNVATSTIVFEGDGEVNEYVGDYNDWLRQYRPKKKSIKKDSETKLKSSQSDKSEEICTLNSEKNIVQTQNNTLSYAEKKELAKLTKQIEKLEQQQSKLHEVTAEPGFYQQDKKSVDDVLQQLKETEQKLEQAYQRWEELEQ